MLPPSDPSELPLLLPPLTVALEIASTAASVYAACASSLVALAASDTVKV